VIKKLIFTLFLLPAAFSGFSQKDSSQYQKFFSRFLSLYKNFSKPPLKNYYEILSNTAKFSCNVTDPLFVNTLAEISTEKKFLEEKAIDLLLERAYTDLRKEYLWIASRDVYESKKEMFYLYNEKLCGCLNSKVKSSDMGERFLAAQKECTIALVYDTVFINKLKTIAGGATLNEMYAVSNYLTIYMYGNCDVFYDKLNASIFNTGAEQYFLGIKYLKAQQGESAIRYFRLGQLDSLSLIFPDYRKYKSELQKAISNSNGKTVYAKGFYFRTETTRGLPVIDVHFYKSRENSNPICRVELKLSGTNINSKIISIKYFKGKPVKEGQIIEDRIIEVKPN
jgi:hypothetical protein